jgi:O-antigen ligase
LALGNQVFGVFVAFLLWALLSTISEGLRYGYEGWYEINFGLLKLGKFTLYAVAGWLTVHLVRSPRDLKRLLLALTAGGLVTTLALPFAASNPTSPIYDPARGFKATNAISVEVAIVVVFLAAAWASGWGGPRWSRFAPWALGVMTIGFAFSRGRGGWLAAAVGFIWYLHRRGFLKRRVVAIALVFVVAVLVAFQQVPVFRFEVTRTLRPDAEYLAKYGAGLMGLDEGARLKTWTHEGAKVFDAPILGRGFYNRFSGSGLWWTGSHSFWIQMFLETGIPGGTAMLAMWWLLWRESRSLGVLPAEVALMVAFVGGMGGEYFYGGMPLLVLIVVLAPLREISVRSLAARQSAVLPPKDVVVALKPGNA